MAVEWICQKCGDTAWKDHCSICGAAKPGAPSAATNGDDAEMQEALAEVVRLHPERDLGDEDAPVATQPREGGYCRHARVTLNSELHRVTCRDCEREVDAFAYLQRLASDWERYATHRKEAQRRATEAHERLKELLRLEQNARARLKRLDPEAEAKAPQRPWGHGSTQWV